MTPDQPLQRMPTGARPRPSPHYRVTDCELLALAAVLLTAGAALRAAWHDTDHAQCAAPPPAPAATPQPEGANLVSGAATATDPDPDFNTSQQNDSATARRLSTISPCERSNIEFQKFVNFKAYDDVLGEYTCISDGEWSSSRKDISMVCCSPSSSNFALRAVALNENGERQFSDLAAVSFLYGPGANVDGAARVSWTVQGTVVQKQVINTTFTELNFYRSPAGDTPWLSVTVVAESEEKQPPPAPDPAQDLAQLHVRACGAQEHTQKYDTSIVRQLAAHLPPEAVGTVQCHTRASAVPPAIHYRCDNHSDFDTHGHAQLLVATVPHPCECQGAGCTTGTRPKVTTCYYGDTVQPASSWSFSAKAGVCDNTSTSAPMAAVHRFHDAFQSDTPLNATPRTSCRQILKEFCAAVAHKDPRCPPQTTAPGNARYAATTVCTDAGGTVSNPRPGHYDASCYTLNLRAADWNVEDAVYYAPPNACPGFDADDFTRPTNDTAVQNTSGVWAYRQTPYITDNKFLLTSTDGAPARLHHLDSPDTRSALYLGTASYNHQLAGVAVEFAGGEDCPVIASPNVPRKWSALVTYEQWTPDPNYPGGPASDPGSDWVTRMSVDASLCVYRLRVATKRCDPPEEPPFLAKYDSCAHWGLSNTCPGGTALDEIGYAPLRTAQDGGNFKPNPTLVCCLARVNYTGASCREYFYEIDGSKTGPGICEKNGGRHDFLGACATRSGFHATVQGWGGTARPVDFAAHAITALGAQQPSRQCCNYLEFSTRKPSCRLFLANNPTVPCQTFDSRTPDVPGTFAGLKNGGFADAMTIVTNKNLNPAVACCGDSWRGETCGAYFASKNDTNGTATCGQDSSQNAAWRIGSANHYSNGPAVPELECCPQPCASEATVAAADAGTLCDPGYTPRTFLRAYDTSLDTFVFANLEFQPNINRNDCCVRTAFCSHNSYFAPISAKPLPNLPRYTSSNGGPDKRVANIVCDSREGMSLRPGDPVGRTTTECCERTGMCQNNTNATANPDVGCFGYVCDGTSRSYTPPEQVGRTTAECCLAPPEPEPEPAP
jgi:hypothetical protein